MYHVFVNPSWSEAKFSYLRPDLSKKNQLKQLFGTFEATIIFIANKVRNRFPKLVANYDFARPNVTNACFLTLRGTVRILMDINFKILQSKYFND